MRSNSSVLQSGVQGLDSMLGGGFTQGRVVLVLGEPGTGKTILCSQFLNAGAVDDQKSVFIGMNEPKSRLLGEMKELGIDFEALERKGKFAYVDATEVRRIPEEARVGRIPVGGRELGLVNFIDMMQESVRRLQQRRTSSIRSQTSCPASLT